MGRHSQRVGTGVPADDRADPTTRLSSYAALIAVYFTVLGAVVWVARRCGIRLPERIPLRDLAIAAVATQRAARLLTKDPITTPVRAPFTDFVGVEGPAALDERARDDSAFRHTVGELLTCPFCVGLWVATAFVVGLVVRPRLTRVVTSLFAVAGVADALQHTNTRLEQSGGQDVETDTAAATVGAGGELIGIDGHGTALVQGPNSR
jgi:hypothetical protein